MKKTFRMYKENIIIDKKVSNLLGVLEWDLEKSKDDSTFDDLFQF